MSWWMALGIAGDDDNQEDSAVDVSGASSATTVSINVSSSTCSSGTSTMNAAGGRKVVSVIL